MTNSSHWMVQYHLRGSDSEDVSHHVCVHPVSAGDPMGAAIRAIGVYRDGIDARYKIFVGRIHDPERHAWSVDDVWIEAQRRATEEAKP